MKHVSGHIQLSPQMYEESRCHQESWSRLERTAWNYHAASPEDRAHLDRVLEAIDRMEEDR